MQPLSLLAAVLVTLSPAAAQPAGTPTSAAESTVSPVRVLSGSAMPTATGVSHGCTPGKFTCSHKDDIFTCNASGYWVKSATCNPGCCNRGANGTTAHCIC